MKTVKFILAAVAAIVLCLMANSCLKDNTTKTTYQLYSYSYTSNAKPDASAALKTELLELCSSSTGKDHTIVAGEFDKIMLKYTTPEYSPYTFDITITYTDGNSTGYLSKSGSL